MSRFCIVLIFVHIALACTSAHALAQLPADRGVVWELPDDPTVARTDLSRMRELGVTAVRTSLIEDERILRLADAFEISLYQEVSAAYLTSRQFADTLEAVRGQLMRALAVAHRSPNARTFGIARYADTSAEATCESIRTLLDEARSAAPAGTRFYYVSFFIEQDRCANLVDFALLDARDHERPSTLLNRWSAAHDSPAGLAAVGTWHAPGTPRGLQSSRSFESQARFLELALTDAIENAWDAPAIFVYQWRDSDEPLPAFHRGERDPYRTTYGVRNDDGSFRPAADVLAGFYRGEQVAFAFDRGEADYRDWPWTVLLTWVVIMMIAILYAVSPRFRNTVPRYFLAHGFYRDSVREGRNLLLASSLTMLIAVALSSGIALAAIVEILGDVTAFRLLMSWLPDVLVTLTGTAATSPLAFILTIALIYAVLEIVWILFLTAISHIRGTLSPGQVMLIAVWPRWPVIVLTLILVALAYGNVSNVVLLPAVVTIVGVWALLTLWSILRAVIDFTIVSRVPAVIGLLMAAIHPFTMVVGTAVILALVYEDRIEFVARASGLL